MPLDFSQAYYEAQSPSLLAEQPLTLAQADAKPGDNWGEIFAHVEQRLGSLRTWRFSWWAYWAEVARFILPRRYHWLVTANVFNKGVPINQEIVDSTATLAMQICAAGLWTGLTNPARIWFKLGAPQGVTLAADAQQWIYDLEQVVYDVLGGSNFYNTMAQGFQDISTFGTAPVIIYEDAQAIIRCYLPCAGEYYLAVGSRLTVDTFYREYTQTVISIVEQFKLKNCPAQVRALWEEGGSSLDKEFVVAHCIEPNIPIRGRKGRDGIRVVPGRFAWREVYWLRGIKTEAELSRRGFHDAPFFVARWSTVSNDPYGRSPGMDCLGDTKQVQLETRRKAEFLEKGVRPPMVGSVDLKNEPSSILPGHLTYVNTASGKAGFEPAFMVNPQWMAPLVEDIKEVNARIERCFFVDVFMAITRMEGVQPRNELELTQRDLERLQALGPFVNLFETEFASPAVMRVVSIVERRGLIRPRPASMANIPLRLECVSMLKLAQRAAQVGAMRQTLATAGSLAEAAQAAGLRSPLRVFNLDESMRILAEKSEYPPNGVYSEDQVTQTDQQRDKQQSQQQTMAATPAAVDAAQGLSQTPLGGNTALSALLGTGGSPAGGAAGAPK